MAAGKDCQNSQVNFTLENTQRGSQADLHRQVVPEVRGHCREGPVPHSFLPDLPWSWAAQLPGLAGTSDSGRTGWEEVLCQISRS